MQSVSPGRTSIAPALLPAARHALCFLLLVSLIATIALMVEVAGGLPSQLAHLYYIPIIIAAVVLRPRYSLAVTLFAVLCVSPAIDGLHDLLGREPYFVDWAPWNLGSTGWITRPIAFIVINIAVARMMETYLAALNERALNVAREQEIRALGLIDKMILSGSSEDDSIKEIARFTVEFHNSRMAGIVMPMATSPRRVSYTGYYREATGLEPFVNASLPYGEGVVGWALMHGRTSWTANLFEDPRYHHVAEFARQRKFVAAAAAAIVLDGEILGALVVGHDHVHEYNQDELEALERTADQAALAISNARQRDALQRMALDTATVLSSVIETRDAYTGDHCERMVKHAGLTAAELLLPTKDIEIVKLGAALHDVGKIVVPDHILRKPGRLTPDEFAVIKQHCYHGGQICKKVPFLEPVHQLVYHHHERFDGEGYPDGLGGDAIPLGARIIAVTDAYDAMTSDRPYREALSFAAACDRLNAGAGSQWDPRVVDAFLETMRAAEAERLHRHLDGAAA